MDKLVLAALVLYLATRKRPEPASGPPKKTYLEYEAPPPEYDPSANDLSAGEYLALCGTGAKIGGSIGLFASPVGGAIGAGVGCLGGIGVGIYQSWG